MTVPFYQGPFGADVPPDMLENMVRPPKPLELLETSPTTVGKTLSVNPLNIDDLGAVIGAGALGPGVSKEIIRITGSHMRARPIVLGLLCESGVPGGATTMNAQGPVVAEISYGNGNSLVAFEVDVPSWRQAPLNNGGSVSTSMMQSGGDGLMLSFSTNFLSVKVRNDGRMPIAIDPTLPVNRNPPTHATLKPVPVRAYVAYGEIARNNFPMYRDLYVANQEVGGQLAAAASQSITVPPFARNLKILRSGMDVIRVSLTYQPGGTAGYGVGPFDVVAGSLGNIDVSGAKFVSFTNTSAAALTTLIARFELAV